MKRKLILLLAFVFAATACSTNEEFVIVNNSGADLVVQFTYKNPDRIIYKPRITTADKLNVTGRKWREVGNENYDIDKDTRIVSVKLASKEALLVTSTTNYAGADDGDFAIAALSLAGESGKKKFEGKEAQTEFKKQENGNYIIFYE